MDIKKYITDELTFPNGKGFIGMRFKTRLASFDKHCMLIMEMTKFLDHLLPANRARIHCVLHDITHIQLCPLCNKECGFAHLRNTFTKYCSLKCAASDPITNKIKANKRSSTNLLKYGCENAAQNQNVKQKIKATNLEKYGDEIASRTQGVKDKTKATNIEVYGVACTLQNAEVNAKAKAALIDKYGVDNPNKSSDVIAKRKLTNIDRYGVDSYSKTQKHRDQISELINSDGFVEKMKLGVFNKYGVYNVMHIEHIAQKAVDNGGWCPRRYYTLPSGRIVKVQGYEDKYLDIYFYELNLPEDDICIQAECPKVKYTLNDKQHTYFPDFYIKSTNTIVEVKSKYTWNMELERNLAKQEATIASGYKYQLEIL